MLISNKRIAFFASGRGSNMQAVINACKEGKLLAEPALVISNNPDSFALERARQENIPAYCLNKKTIPIATSVTAAILEKLERYRIDLILLVGYMKKIEEEIIKAYPEKIINIHPALLPKFGGKGMYGHYVHEAVIAAGETESGATVHLVDEEYDRGRILGQEKVAVLPGETAESLAKKVLVKSLVKYLSE
jgi:phosphoribosylglycinamide formyltransferase 1